MLRSSKIFLSLGSIVWALKSACREVEQRKKNHPAVQFYFQCISKKQEKSEKDGE